MSFISYAQNFEDVRLWRAFSDIAAGRYLDIGTQDPVQDSVSLAFYERGWRGVHVEPTSTYAAAIRAARPDETVIEAAVSADPGPMRLFEIPATGLTTGIAAIAERHAKSGWTYSEITVPTVTLAGLFDHMGPDLIHWLKIDVEGMEGSVLESWGDHPARPAALVIEATAPTTQQPTDAEWRAMVLDRGYEEVLFDGLSRYFIHKDHAHRGAALALSPNVFDGFQVQPGHFTTALLAAQKEGALSEIREQLEHKLRLEEAASAEARKFASATEFQLAAAKQDIESLERAVAEQSNTYASAWRHALNQISASERTLAVTKDHLARLQQDLLLSTEENKRIAATLEAQIKASIEQYADTVQQRDAFAQEAAARGAERDRLADELQAGHQHAASLKIEIMRLHHHSERQLHQASELLDGSRHLLSGLPNLRKALVRWLVGRSRWSAMGDHQSAVVNWQTALRSAAPEPEDKEKLSFPSSLIGAGKAQMNGCGEKMDSDVPITSVPQLLAPHDLNFIHAAYQALLGRAPDAEGEAYYLTRLRAGDHKLEILKQLRRSAEGKAFIPGVAGLDRALRRHGWATMHLVGAIVRLFTGVEGNNATHRKLRVLANEIGAMRSDLEEFVMNPPVVTHAPDQHSEWSTYEANVAIGLPPMARRIYDRLMGQGQSTGQE